MVERVGKAFEVWYESLRGKPETNRRLRMMESFLEWRGWGYEELYDRYLAAIRGGDPRDLALINTGFVGWFKEIRGRGLSSGYAGNHVGVIVSFLTGNGLTVNFNGLQRKEMIRRPVRIKDNWAKEEIREALAATTSPRNQALIQSLKDCGMAVSDLGDLNVEDLKPALDAGDKFTQIDYVRNKTGELGWPCFGYESLDAMRVWLRWRRVNGFNCEPSSPLFVLTQNPEGAGKYGRDELLSGIRMRGKTISESIFEVVRRAGLTGKRLSAHSFRIYNSSCLESAGVNKNIVYRIQARQIPDSGRAYSKGEVLSSYMKAYDSLVVGPRPQIIEVPNPDTERVLAENANLRAQVAALQSSSITSTEVDIKLAELKMEVLAELAELDKLELEK